MKAKDYMMQARYLDRRIKSKTDQMQQMRDLAVKVTQVISDMPKAPSGSTARMADTVSKIIDYETEISIDLEKLVLLKKDILAMTKMLTKPEYQMILEKRYVDMQHWDDIADDLGFDPRWVQRLHGKALAELQQYIDKKKP